MKVGKEMTGLNGHWTERRLKSEMEECLDASFPKRGSTNHKPTRKDGGKRGTER